MLQIAIYNAEVQLETFFKECLSCLNGQLQFDSLRE